MKVFLTGSTGLLGKSLLNFFLIDENNEIFILVRSLEKIDRISQNSKRVHVLLGDITKSDLGVSDEDRLRLINSIDHIYHCAALTNFNASPEMLHAVNVNGTQNLLVFAAQCRRLTSFHYVSSAFIAGKYEGYFTEQDFDLNQEFNNDYEKSKYEAERKVREFSKNLSKVVIYRPGVIVGDEHEELAHKNNLLYLIFKLLSLDKFYVLPISKSALINILPANIVAEAIYSLKDNKNNDVFHIVNPVHFSLSKIIEEGCKKFNYVVPKFNSSCNMTELTPLENKMLQPFMPYLFLRAAFDSKKTINSLAENGYQYPSITMDRILNIIK